MYKLVLKLKEKINWKILCFLIIVSLSLAVNYIALMKYSVLNDYKSYTTGVLKVFNNSSDYEHLSEKINLQHEPSNPSISEDWVKQMAIARFSPKVFNCVKLIQGDENEQDRVLKQPTYKYMLNADYYINKSANCDQFLLSRNYIISELTKEERDFPIAFSIVIYKDIELFERLLRAIYRPQNYYCIHIDTKASREYKRAVESIASCLTNVFTFSSIDVQWGAFSVLEPELLCMEWLLQFRNWRYFINLTGQEFPLKTNLELVKILKALDGANNMHGTVKRYPRPRTKYVKKPGVPRNSVLKSPCPVNLTLTKGSVHIIASRGFVEFTRFNKSAIAFREWLKDTDIPDETLFTTLNYNPHLGAPGAYLGEPETTFIDVEKPRNPFIARFKNWGGTVFKWPCGGKRVRLVCVFGVRDLPLLATRKELFANKFNADFQPEAYNCLEELLFNRTLYEMEHGSNINISFYSNLDFVKNHV